MRTPAKIALIAAICLTTIFLATCKHAPVDRSQGFTLLFELQTPPSASPEEESRLVSATIQVLKQRLDPLAEFNFQFTKVGSRRIEIWIPNSLKSVSDQISSVATANGILDFRITVDPADLAKDPAAGTAAFQSLAQNGPQHSITALGTRLRWMQIAPQGRDNFKSGFVVQNWSGDPYVLCYDNQFQTLTHDRPKPWTVRAGEPFNSSSGLLLLPFTLDSNGAICMAQLTTDNMHKPMAILLDDKAMSAPYIQTRIEDSGTISFGRSHTPEEVKKEANNIRRIMDAGTLPAKLTPVPPSASAPATLPS